MSKPLITLNELKEVKDVLLIILGWLFGILSPIIVNRISNKYQKKSLEQIIINELKDLKKRLALLPYRVKSDYGIVDQELIIWMKTQIEDLEKSESDKAFTLAYEKMNLENSGDLTNFLTLCNTANLRENPSFHFKEMLTSIIDSNLINFGILDKGLLQKLLEVKFQINVFNEEVRCVNDYLKMTFDSTITDTNHQIIKDEIKRKNLLIVEKAVLIIEKINHIIVSEK